MNRKRRKSLKTLTQKMKTKGSYKTLTQKTRIKTNNLLPYVTHPKGKLIAKQKSLTAIQSPKPLNRSRTSKTSNQITPRYKLMILTILIPPTIRERRKKLPKHQLKNQFKEVTSGVH
jgi:hypothetical protein